MKRSGFIRATLLIAFLLCAGGGGIYVWQKSLGSASDKYAGAVTVPIIESEFVASVNESGEIESSSNIEIRCHVKSQGREGTTILAVVAEGSVVTSGDFLCQLDDSLLRDQQIEQQIQVARDKATVIQAQSDLATANGLLNEFEKGVAAQELAALKAEMALADEGLKRSTEYYGHSQMLNRKGFVTRTQLEADGFAVEKAKQDRDLAIQKLEVYEKYTRQRTNDGFRLEIEKQEANLEAANYTLKLSRQRENEFQQQVDNCRITAPSKGTVIYANDVDRRGDASFVIEEGAMLRDGQPIFFLPDTSRMQVRATVNESKIGRVTAGQNVKVRLDSAPDKVFEGEVRSIAAYPLPRRWFDAPIEYEVVVGLVNPGSDVRTGLRAKVEILTETIPSVRQAPISAVIPHADERFVLVRDNGKLVPRAIKTGSNNDRFVIIEEGVEAGEEVLIDPESYRNDVDFPVAIKP